MTPLQSCVFYVGNFRVDPALDEVFRDGATVKLEPRAMRVLVCLAEHAGEVLSVDQLLDPVWKDVLVTPDSVYQAVAGLRRALKDDPKNPTHIVNVQRRGYRLIAPVSSAEHGHIASPPPLVATTQVDVGSAQQPQIIETAPAKNGATDDGETPTLPGNLKTDAVRGGCLDWRDRHGTMSQQQAISLPCQ
jgi:DNA-binding winged helix-turn-helix (wHTH) protein